MSEDVSQYCALRIVCAGSASRMLDSDQRHRLWPVMLVLISSIICGNSFSSQVFAYPRCTPDTFRRHEQFHVQMWCLNNKWIDQFSLISNNCSNYSKYWFGSYRITCTSLSCFLFEAVLLWCNGAWKACVCIFNSWYHHLSFSTA